MFGEVALDGSDAAAKAFTSHYTTHDRMQAILDFPFQDAARGFASKGLDNQRLAPVLPQRRLVHRPRLQRLRAADVPRQPRHGPVRLLPEDRQPGRRRRRAARPRPAGPPADVLLARQPGRLLRRRAGLHRHRRRPARPADDVRQPGAGLQGRRADRLRPTPAPTTTSTPHSPHVPRRSAELGAVTAAHPALRNGAEQVRYASDGAGRLRVLAHRPPGTAGVRRRAQQQRRGTDSATVPTYLDGGSTATGLRHRRPGASEVDRHGSARGPGARTVDGRLRRRTSRSRARSRAPRITLAKPAPGRRVERPDARQARTVRGSSFYEVTFQRRVGHAGHWRTIGVDDSAPYQVFHDTARPAAPGPRRSATAPPCWTTPATPAAARSRRPGCRPAGSRSTAPADGGTVANIDPVTVSATVDPELPTQSVRFQRSVDGGAVDRPRDRQLVAGLRATDDVADLPLGTLGALPGDPVRAGPADGDQRPGDRDDRRSPRQPSTR